MGAGAHDLKAVVWSGDEVVKKGKGLGGGRNMVRLGKEAEGG